MTDARPLGPGTRALVTGATGFIGRYVVAALAARGVAVRALVRPTSQTGGLAAEPVIGDIDRPETLPPAVSGVDVVFHLASLLKVPWKPEFHTVNVDGTAHVARAAAAAGARLVVVGSLAAAGPITGDRPRRESDPPTPVSRYGRVKRAAEQAAVAAGAAVSIVRPPMVFGAGDRGALPLFAGATRGWHVVPTRRPARIGLVHAADLAEALITVAERGEAVPAGADGACGAGVYQVACPESPTYAELGRRIGRAAGRGVRVVALPSAITALAAGIGELVGRLRDRPTVLNRDKYREAVGGDWWCATDKITALGWWPAAALDLRLAETIAGYRADGWLPPDPRALPAEP